MPAPPRRSGLRSSSPLAGLVPHHASAWHRTVAVSVYGSRADIPVTVWTELFGGALEAIDILVYGGTFLFDGVARFPKLLTAATDRGVAVRFIIGDPDSTAVAQRGAEEQIGSSLAGRCRMTLARLQPLVGTAGLEIRTHTTPLYTSMFRADDTLIANPHLYGAPALSLIHI